MESLFTLIDRPVVTEKSQRGELSGVYTLQIDPRATKVDIRTFIERAYGVRVRKVNIVKTREKFRNTRQGMKIKRAPVVKAMVSLEGNDRIADFSQIAGVASEKKATAPAKKVAAPKKTTAEKAPKASKAPAKKAPKAE